jgi:hypothetical protein
MFAPGRRSLRAPVGRWLSGLTLIAGERMVGQSIASTIQRNGVIDTLGHRRLDRVKVALILGGLAGDRVIG